MRDKNSIAMTLEQIHSDVRKLAGEVADLVEQVAALREDVAFALLAGMAERCRDLMTVETQAWRLAQAIVARMKNPDDTHMPLPSADRGVALRHARDVIQQYRGALPVPSWTEWLDDESWLHAEE